MALSILEELCYCTTRIETKDKEGNLYSGTGFFYSFKGSGGGSGGQVP